MPGSLPPYALDLTSFRFPALAALAGRAPLGGAREAALAALLVARLADGVSGEVDPAIRRERAQLARQWLAGLSLPTPARSALGRAIDATAGPGATPALRLALEAAAGAIAPLLDAPARAELQQLSASS